MNTPIKTNAALNASVQVYRVLLILYPAEYRRDYGELMAQVFRDMCRDAYQAQGLTGMLLWWCRTLLDLIFTAIEERRKVSFMFTRATFVQMAGFLLIVGGLFLGAASFSQLQPDNHYIYQGIYRLLWWLYAPGSLLVGFGCISLALRYEPALGSMGKWMLILTGVSSIGMAVGDAAVYVTGNLWGIWFVSGLAHAAVLTGFGLVNAVKSVLPVFRWLPLMMVVGWLLLIVLSVSSNSQMLMNALSFLFWLGIGLGWLAIGQATNRQQQETATIAAAQ